MTHFLTVLNLSANFTNQPFNQCQNAVEHFRWSWSCISRDKQWRESGRAGGLAGLVFAQTLLVKTLFVQNNNCVVSALLSIE